MKKIIITIILLIIFSNIVYSLETPLETLHLYYEADKNEDINKLMELTDFSHVPYTELEDFKSQTKRILVELARIFDTISYSISNEDVAEKRDNALITYELKSELKDIYGKEGNIKNIFVAVLHKTGNEWKVVYIRPIQEFENNILSIELLLKLSEDFEEIEELKESYGYQKGILQRIWEFISNILKRLFGIEDKQEAQEARVEEIGLKKDETSEKIDIPKPEDEKQTDNYKDSTELQKARQEYITAYNKLTDLMARGKGDTPEAQEAYEEYKTAKKKYESLSQK